MKSPLKILVCFLLLFNAIGAVYGGWNLILHPDGSSLQMSLDYLNHSTFHNYLIPGIILFVANGLFGFFVVLSLIFHFKYYPQLVISQGLILTGWILIQIILIHMINSLHLIMGSTGILLILLGLLLKK